MATASQLRAQSIFSEATDSIVLKNMAIASSYNYHERLHYRHNLCCSLTGLCFLLGDTGMYEMAINTDKAVRSSSCGSLRRRWADLMSAGPTMI
jgi:hypothetical protein